jgi:hypothetical protein
MPAESFQKWGSRPMPAGAQSCTPSHDSSVGECGGSLRPRKSLESLPSSKSASGTLPSVDSFTWVPVSVSFLTSTPWIPPSAIVFEDDAPIERSAFLTCWSWILPLATESAPRSAFLTSPLMMSSEPTWFWPASGPSTA